MWLWSTSGWSWGVGPALLLGWPLLFGSAHAASQSKQDLKSAMTRSEHTISHPITNRGTKAGSTASRAKVTQMKAMLGKARAGHASGISCVPYARMLSGIEVPGNAWQWWDNAAGSYARGTHPEPGGVLNFRSNPNMRLGHVAVVRKVVNAREVLIDHANWPSGGMRGGVSHSIAVVDVSEANDWSAVRVELGRSGSFGAVYPTYGFIYARPDHGVLEAAVTAPTPQPELNPAPRDLRPVAERPWRTYEEVAEAPVRGGTPGKAPNLSWDVPGRR